MSSKEKISRKLTAGEIVLVQAVFKNSVNTAHVRVHNTKFIFFQSDDVLMTPNGDIYAAEAYVEDFSAHGQDDASLFIHEMVHVWQKQNHVLNPLWAGVGAFLRHPFKYSKNYDYTLDANKDLLKYKLEQQAQIIQDYFQIFQQSRGPWADNMKNKVSEGERNKLYLAVLARFLANPSYPTTAAQGTSGLEQGYVGGGYGGGGGGSW